MNNSLVAFDPCGIEVSRDLLACSPPWPTRLGDKQCDERVN